MSTTEREEPRAIWPNTNYSDLDKSIYDMLLSIEKRTETHNDLLANHFRMINNRRDMETHLVLHNDNRMPDCKYNDDDGVYEDFQITVNKILKKFSYVYSPMTDEREYAIAIRFKKSGDIPTISDVHFVLT